MGGIVWIASPSSVTAEGVHGGTGGGREPEGRARCGVRCGEQAAQVPPRHEPADQVPQRVRVELEEVVGQHLGAGEQRAEDVRLAGGCCVIAAGCLPQRPGRARRRLEHRGEQRDRTVDHDRVHPALQPRWHPCPGVRVEVELVADVPMPASTGSAPGRVGGAREPAPSADDQVTHGPLPVCEDRRDAPVGLARVPDELGAEAQLAAEAGEQQRAAPRGPPSSGLRPAQPRDRGTSSPRRPPPARRVAR